MKFKKKSGKPFKSGNKVNTYKSTTVNPNSGKQAYAFIEDDSIVDVFKLIEVADNICTCGRAEIIYFCLCQSCMKEVEDKFYKEEYENENLDFLRYSHLP